MLRSDLATFHCDGSERTRERLVARGRRRDSPRERAFAGAEIDNDERIGPLHRVPCIARLRGEQSLEDRRKVGARNEVSLRPSGRGTREKAVIGVIERRFHELVERQRSAFSDARDDLVAKAGAHIGQATRARPNEARSGFERA